MVFSCRKVFVLCVALSLVFSFTGLALAQPPDIGGHWAQPQITDWLNQGLCSGYPDGTFRPDNGITRAEFITLVNKAFGFAGDGQVDLADVSRTDWFYGQVAAALGAGYITGYEDNTMRPGKNIERQEVAVILARLLGLTPDPAGGLPEFADEASMAGWSKDAIRAVVQNGLMKGYPDGNFRPQNPITRAEALVCLERALGFKPLVLESKTGISGLVTRAGSGVKDVTVTVFKAGASEAAAKAATNEKGFFELDLPPGSYDLTAVTADAVAYASGVKVEKDVANVELVLSPGAVVNGSIVDKNGQAVAGAKVSYLSGNLVFTAVTGSDGTYTIVVPKDKKYTVLAVDPAKPDSEPAELARYLSIGNLGKYQVDSLEAPFGAEPAAAGGSGKGRSSSNMPEITALTVDVTEGTPVLTLNAWGRSTVDFSALPGTTLITGGSVTVNRACEIALTSQTDKFPFGLSTTQELVEGVNNLDIISYLGVLDAGQDGVSLKKLKEVFGAAVDFYATLTDNNGRTAYVTLGLILP